jgi:hypothetical protein
MMKNEARRHIYPLECPKPIISLRNIRNLRQKRLSKQLSAMMLTNSCRNEAISPDEFFLKSENWGI